MNWIPNAPLLAIDAGSVFTVVFLIVMFLGWLMQMVSGQNNPPPQKQRQQRGEQRQRPRRRPAQGDRIANEIDAFLQEVGDREPERARPDEIELVAPPPRRPPAKKRARPRRRPSKRPAPPRQPPSQPTLGGNVREHVSSYMSERVADEAREHVGSLDVNAGRTGEPTAEQRAALALASSTRSTAPHPLVSLLRQPEGARQAILLNEILAKPRSLR